MKRGCGKAQINGDDVLPDNADGEETGRMKSKEGLCLCELGIESGVLLQSCCADINARMEACVRVCVRSSYTCLYFYVTLSFSLFSLSILKLF